MELAPKMEMHLVAKQVRKHVTECHSMFKMLESYQSLGKTKTVIDANGQRITKCPPAYARGAYPPRNVGQKS